MQKSRSNRRITDLGHGHHLSPDGMSVTKDGEPGVLSKILETDKSVFFQGGDRNAILWTTDGKGAIGGLSSDNSFAETGCLDPLKAVIARAGERAAHTSGDVRPYLPELADAFGREPPALGATATPFHDAEAWGHRALSNPNTIRPASVPEALHAHEIGSDPAPSDRPWVVPNGSISISKERSFWPSRSTWAKRGASAQRQRTYALALPSPSRSKAPREKSASEPNHPRTAKDRRRADWRARSTISATSTPRRSAPLSLARKPGFIFFARLGATTSCPSRNRSWYTRSAPTQPPS